MTHRHWSRSLVRSCPEDWLGSVGKWSFSVHAPVDDYSSHMLCPFSVYLSLDALSFSACSAPHSAKAPSTYIVQRNTYGHECSLENMLFTFTWVLSVQRGQSSCKGLPPLFGYPKVNCRTEEGIDRRLNGSERHSGRRESVLCSRREFCLARLTKNMPRSLLVNRFSVLNVEEINTDIIKPIDVPFTSAPDKKALPQKPK